MTTEWQPTSVLMEAVASGRRADIIIATEDALIRLTDHGALEGEGRLRLADARLGTAVPNSKPRSDITTLEGFCQALMSARSVAYSKHGASGIYFSELIRKLGIADAINSRATVISSGLTAEKLLTGEADVAVQQISELMMVQGVEIVRPFPDAIQSVTTFGAAIFTDCQNRPAAEAFMELLHSQKAKSAYQAYGLAPR